MLIDCFMLEQLIKNESRREGKGLVVGKYMHMSKVRCNVQGGKELQARALRREGASHASHSHHLLC